MKMKIERSKSGIPAIWEMGGGFTNTGEARIIAGKDGKEKKAMYISRRGELANSNHALVPIEIGDLVVDADHHRGDFVIQVNKITNILKDHAELSQIAEYKNGEWDNKDIAATLAAWENGEAGAEGVPKKIWDLCLAILAAQEKSTCYHCREPHYIKI